MMLPCERNIEIAELVREASLLHTEGYRMVTATCVNVPDGVNCSITSTSTTNC